MSDNSTTRKQQTGGFNIKSLFAAALPLSALYLPLVFGFIASAAGVAIGWRARREIAETGDRGLALAWIGIVLGTLAAIACAISAVYVWRSNN